MTCRTIDEQAAQEIYEAIMQQTQRDYSEYERPRTLPRFKIPGELAFFLDELLGYASEELEQEMGDTIAEILDIGITHWYMNLPLDIRKSLGLELTNQKNPNSDRQKTDGTILENIDKKVKRLQAESKKLNREKEALCQTQAKLEREIEQLKKERQANLQPHTEVEPNPSFSTNFNSKRRPWESNYTPLTMHQVPAK